MQQALQRAFAVRKWLVSSKESVLPDLGRHRFIPPKRGPPTFAPAAQPGSKRESVVEDRLGIRRWYFAPRHAAHDDQNRLVHQRAVPALVGARCQPDDGQCIWATATQQLVLIEKPVEAVPRRRVIAAQGKECPARRVLQRQGYRMFPRVLLGRRSTRSATQIVHLPQRGARWQLPRRVEVQASH